VTPDAAALASLALIGFGARLALVTK